MTAPNSKVRAFHVESVCDIYNRHTSGLVDRFCDVAGSSCNDGGALDDERGDRFVMFVGILWSKRASHSRDSKKDTWWKVENGKP